ncbi:hypothetical protein BJ165DRAFT_1409824 [Panaeolus papilionaceus]|nr:hypothetical protein BJ165DRAFT_1409824 [Panaeolus papilionaceus]
MNTHREIKGEGRGPEGDEDVKRRGRTREEGERGIGLVFEYYFNQVHVNSRRDVKRKGRTREEGEGGVFKYYFNQLHTAERERAKGGPLEGIAILQSHEVQIPNISSFPIDNMIQDATLGNASTLDHEVESQCALPTDVLILVMEMLCPKDICALLGCLGTCKGIKFRLQHAANQVVRRYIQNIEPWFLPAGPFDFPTGRKECDYWSTMWAKQGYEGSDIEFRLPWLAYRQACSHSLNMWSRIRIWRIARQMEDLARKLEYI